MSEELIRKKKISRVSHQWDCSRHHYLLTTFLDLPKYNHMQTNWKSQFLNGRHLESKPIRWHSQHGGTHGSWLLFQEPWNLKTTEVSWKIQNCGVSDLRKTSGHFCHIIFDRQKSLVHIHCKRIILYYKYLRQRSLGALQRLPAMDLTFTTCKTKQ